MIPLDAFYLAYEHFRPPANSEQRKAVGASARDGVFIVAGPGAGKTASLTLRILKLVLVDGLPPKGIVATTFTKKAAAELRSRILGWGFRLIEELLGRTRLPAETRDRLSRLDINQVMTGTIDSVCEQLLREHREPGAQPPVLADDFISKTLLLREGLFGDRRDLDPDLETFLLGLYGPSSWGWHVGRKNELVQTIWDRRSHDQVDWSGFLGGGGAGDRRARARLGEVVAAYQKALSERSMVDFALLEQEVLQRLRDGKLEEFRAGLRVVLVDEYQDTNLLQEQLYFELAKRCHGALTVVGDDDQSLYRFRGATVELFSEFPGRFAKAFGRLPVPVFLTTNYRSTKRIVALTERYARLDKEYQAVRVKAKPSLLAGPAATEGAPILGMFRDDVATLGRDLATFIHAVFRKGGYTLPNGHRLLPDDGGGDLGDCALLCSSPAEYNRGEDERLPLILRRELGTRSPAVPVFNPRGQDLTGIPIVRIFGGLLLECLDPGGTIEMDTKGLSQGITATFQDWRQAAVDYAERGSPPAGLRDFAIGWGERDPKKRGWEWPRSVPALELVYGLLHFFPELHDDPEGQIYLEVFTRQLAACGLVGKFDGRAVHDPDNKGLADASVKELLRDFLGPIAGGSVSVNEELIEAFPRDRLSILSIHQSKGLEFPLVIVDVGSDFRSNHKAHRFKRFPDGGGTPHRMEDLLRPFSALAAPKRSQTDRAFDDLYRQFFVAYSRAQEVLLLVGLRKTLPGGAVSNVATGWTREGVCSWAPDTPFTEI